MQHGLLTLRYENSSFSFPLDLGIDGRYQAMQDLVTQVTSIDMKQKHVSERIQMAEMKLKGKLNQE